MHVVEVKMADKVYLSFSSFFQVYNTIIAGQ